MMVDGSHMFRMSFGPELEARSNLRRTSDNFQILAVCAYIIFSSPRSARLFSRCSIAKIKSKWIEKKWISFQGCLSVLVLIDLNYQERRFLLILEKKKRRFLSFRRFLKRVILHGAS